MNFRLNPALAPVLLVLALNVFAQEREARPQEDPAQQRIRALEERLNFMEQSLAKDIDDLMWFRRMDDIAVVDKVSYTGPPPRVIPNPTGQGAGNPVIISAYTFLPKRELAAAKLPPIVFVHGGVHGDFSS
ncbi:MAG: S9 family peptidase, partial [Blastocatellia bacterium]|nr:S9 family peptidase [Blastocatellia bacterium]